jgi:hypothetical protein
MESLRDTIYNNISKEYLNEVDTITDTYIRTFDKETICKLINDKELFETITKLMYTTIIEMSF